MKTNDKHSESMLVKGEDLDQLLLLAGEVIITSSNQGLVFRGLQSLHDNAGTVDQGTLAASKDLASSTSLLSSDLHHLVQSIRTVNLKDLGFRARRLVRDISRKTGKLINFEFVGEETTIDKAIVEKIYDPISHQLRNAVDHGIEDVQTRSRLGKPKEGQVTLKAFNTDQETIIEIIDDGAGIPLETFHKKAVDEGLLAEGSPMTEDTALELLCTPGFTTSQTVSNISGRGVGMDVVRTALDELGGSISFKTESEKGTTFTFRIPIATAVNIVDALVVRADENIYAFPISNVVASTALSKDEISSAFKKGRMIKYLGALLPVHGLNDVFERRLEVKEWDEDQKTIPILIIEHKSKRIALIVSEFLAPQKLVIIPFNEAITVTGLLGSTILGGRKLGYIVDIPALVGLASDKDWLGAAGRPKEETEEQSENAGKSKDAEEDRKEDASAESYFVETEVSNVVRQEFVAELEKFIPELNEIVFALESDPSDNEKINAAFRLFHTIKGNLIMMGLPKGGETIHSVESVLDNARNEKMGITSEVMDVIMDGVSYVENVVQNMKTEKWEDKAADDILERSAALLPEQSLAQKDVGDVFSAEIRLTHESEYRAMMHRKKRSQFYHIYIEFDPGTQPSFLVACLLYRRMSDVGDVLGTVPQLSDIEKGLMDGKIKLLFTSTYEQKVLEQSLEELFTRHYGATSVNLTSVVL